MLKGRHDRAVEERGRARNNLDFVRLQHDAMQSAREGLIRDTEYEIDSEAVAKLKRTAQEKGQKEAEYRDETELRIDNLDRERKAALWDSKEHYEANKEAYQVAAEEDARAHGVEINHGSSTEQ